ncbi:hypothetical protein V1499_17050 [Neobacillus sp. SCS-31]|uniref:hypothetical protein n=1 Tax=Neobacillus oceani TaxID=3115292 RepID=UPI00390600B8
MPFIGAFIRQKLLLFSQKRANSPQQADKKIFLLQIDPDAKLDGGVKKKPSETNGPGGQFFKKQALKKEVYGWLGKGITSDYLIIPYTYFGIMVVRKFKRIMEGEHNQ